ncbi:MAG: SDR family NAD(P)-dependent oxidoreductase [Deltaproteobacteria bacterium]|nr:SDR family NAD(P)-dependent oxidoreductase [Deltaproteobacteria bacterium]
MNFNGKTILITGASMGIGESIAREFSNQGARVLLVARSRDRLEKLTLDLKPTTQPHAFFAADLTKEEDRQYLVSWIQSQGSLDGVIHNAGMILYEPFEKCSPSQIRQIFELNFFSILFLTQALLPLLEKGKEPTLLVISSAASWRSLPFWSLYCSTKAALTQWMEGLRLELKPKGIHCVTVYPGVTQTSLSDNAPSSGPKAFATTEGKGSTPEEVAYRVAAAYEKGKRDEYVITFNRLYRLLSFLFPKAFDQYFVKLYQKKGWL